ncbi:hypothetical protein MHK_000240, partial [Candidatus Magnetomorum sp. HK-1]
RLNLSYIVISHENDFLYDTTDSIFTMEDGKIIPGEKIHRHKHEHPHETHNHHQHGVGARPLLSKGSSMLLTF